MTQPAYLPLSSSIGRVFDEIRPRIPDVVMILGPDEASQDVRYPSINWTPVRGVHSAARSPANRQGDPGSLWTSEETVAVTFHARNVSETQALRELFVQALHGVASHMSYRLGEFDWSVGGAATYGTKCTVAVTLFLPVRRAETGKVTVTDVNFTVEVLNPTEE